MFDRRRLLFAATATAGAAGADAALAGRGGGGAPHLPRGARSSQNRQSKTKPTATGSDPATAARLNAVLETIFEESLKESPQGMTGLGLDKGPGAWARSKLDDASPAAVERGNQLTKKWLAELRAVDRKKLKGMDAVNYDTVEYQGAISVEGTRFHYGSTSGGGYPIPYLLSQLTGSYQAVPDFLDSQHPIENAADAEAYLSRLAQFATVMDQETERATADGAKGVIPPDFVIDKTLAQLKALRGTPTDKTTLVDSVARRTREKGIAGDWAGRAAATVNGPVWAAVNRQIALMEAWRPKAVHDAGVWRLPDGLALYRYCAKEQTTTNMSAEEIHKLGLDMVAKLSAEADALFKSQGMSQGSVGQRMAALFKDPRFIYPNTEEGKAKLLEYLNGLVKQMTAMLPRYFGALPKAGLDIRRVPVAIEAGAPGGYYNSGTLDGSRPGAYYINLRDTAEVPRWTLPTLSYHEGVPGHHLQGTLVLEAKGIPMIRKVLGYNAYQEGWALYSEQLADEIGMYKDDPWGRLGYLHDAIFRGVRLVVDSGMHAKRWSREQAVKYYVDTIGDPESVAITEIERYCVWPGQACGYMVGKVELLRLRAAMRAKLGAKFDIRRFHDAVLLTGSMPLEVLARRLDDWAAAGGVG